MPHDVGYLIASYAEISRPDECGQLDDESEEKLDVGQQIQMDMLSWLHAEKKKKLHQVVDNTIEYLVSKLGDESENYLKEISLIAAFKKGIPKLPIYSKSSLYGLSNCICLEIVKALQGNDLLNLLDSNREFMKTLSPFDINGDVYANQQGDPFLYPSQS